MEEKEKLGCENCGRKQVNKQREIRDFSIYEVILKFLEKLY